MTGHDDCWFEDERSVRFFGHEVSSVFGASDLAERDSSASIELQQLAFLVWGI